MFGFGIQNREAIVGSFCNGGKCQLPNESVKFAIVIYPNRERDDRNGRMLDVALTENQGIVESAPVRSLHR